MCGIAGLFAYGTNALQIERDELTILSAAQSARGPDGSGMWESPDRRIGFAHRRLSIIDLTDAAAQPMASADGIYVITFNGEIYNFRELKRELESEGVRFRTGSDTELLLALYRCYGESMLERIRGMFAFAIWDSSRRELFAARDPFGIKPLYFVDDGRVFRFASQVKALVRTNAVRLTPNPAGHVGFFIFGFIPEPHTLYREIRSLPAGHWLKLNEGGRVRIKSYYDVRQRLAEASENSRIILPGEQEEIVRAALADTISHHLVSDVPVGVFLSAGIDSNVIAASVARQVGFGQLRTVTLGFEEFAGTSLDEVPLAEQQARMYGALHTTRRVQEDEFYASLASIWASMDQPSVDGVNSWLVSRAASEAGLKVCLSGVGGDELFGGYPSFKQVPRLVNLMSRVPIPRGIRSIYRGVFRAIPEQLLSPKVSGLLDYGKTIGGSYLLRRGLFLPEELEKFLDAAMVAEGLEELMPLMQLEKLALGIAGDRGKVASMEISWYMRHQLLRDADWASMAHGLELRTPLVDRGFMEAILPVIVAPDPATKAILLKCIPDELSSAIRGRTKTGFATPVRRWLEGRYTKSSINRGLRGWSRVVYAEFVPELSLAPSDPIPPRLAERQPVIVYRIGQLGDTLVSLPAFQAIRSQHPDEQIVLLTDRHPSRGHYVSAWDVLGPTRLLDGVIYYPISTGRWKNFVVYVTLAFRLRKLLPKEVINLAPRVRKREVARDAIFFKRLVGVDHYWALPASGMQPRGASNPAQAPREWQRLLRLVTVGDELRGYDLPLPKWAVNEASFALGSSNDVRENLVAIAPGSKMSSKRWQRERFEAVGQHILSEFPGLNLAVIGGNEDVAIGNLLCSAWGERSTNLAGKLSIFGSAAVLKRCLVYVGNDSGAMHLAAQVGTPCVAIFSSRDTPGKWDPFGSNHRVLRFDLSCSGCMLENCDRGNECLDRITVDAVFAAFRECLVFAVDASRSPH